MIGRGQRKLRLMAGGDRPMSSLGRFYAMDETSQMLVRFHRLLEDVESGASARNTFRPWEVELLVDLNCCELGPNRRRVLRRWERAVQRGLESGAQRPLKLSDYLMRTRKTPRAPAA